MSYFLRVAAMTPTRFWVNNVTRADAKLALDAGATGCTQNPAYLSKVIGSPDDGEWIASLMDEAIAQTADDDEAVAELQRRVIAGICDVFSRLYEASGGRSGMVSIQANPFREDRETILENAERCMKLRKNFIIKIPATREGLLAIRDLVAARIPVLATEVMSIDQTLDLIALYQNVAGGMKNPAPFWFAHINGIFDEHLADTAKTQNINIRTDALRQASFALGKKMHVYLRESGVQGINYVAGGARGLHHFTDMVGVNGAITVNWKGTADKLVGLNGPVVDVFSAPTPVGFVDELLEKIPDFKKAYVPHSLSQDEYESFGPVTRFRNQFEEGWIKARSAVAACRAGKS